MLEDGGGWEFFVLDRAREVLEIEGRAILSLKDRLDRRFLDAVNLVLECRGRVIVTGMGKSGAVARKIASTLASTGTPALFMHPADGVHGDLGMVAAGDLVLAFSNSGEADELVAILPVIKRIGAALVAVVGSCDSTLARASDVAVEVHVEREACPLGLAPTASSTAMLALGDALALAAMGARDFRREDYALLHPGGMLGRRLTLLVEDVMRTGERVAVVREEDSVRGVIKSVTDAGAGAAAVVDGGGRLTGIITDGDIRRAMLSDESCLDRRASEVMTPEPKVIGPRSFAAEGMRILEVFKIGELPVPDEGGRPVGMLMMKDLFRAGIT
jgi:arabinose-5-phosphate isomerase